MRENIGEKRLYFSKIFKGKQSDQLTKRNAGLFLFFMLLAPVLNWIMFWLIVNINSVLLAFKSQRTGKWSPENFVTFWNRLTTSGGELGIALKNTFYYFITNVLVLIPVALLISYFIYKKIFLYKVYKVIFYLPAIISGVVMVTVYTRFIDPRGPLGAIAKWFGKELPPEGLLGRTGSATFTILVYTVWTGFATNMILFCGGMSRIPDDIIEAAKIEGCSPMKEIIYIVFPLIFPTFSTMLILSFTGIFTASGPILLFAPEGEFNTSTLSFWIFKQVYGSGTVGGTGSYNLVSCVGLCFTLIGVPIILTVKWLLEKIPPVEY